MLNPEREILSPPPKYRKQSRKLDRNILTIEDGKESYETLSSGNKTDVSTKYYTTSTPLHLRMREHHRREGIKIVRVREPRCLL